MPAPSKKKVTKTSKKVVKKVAAKVTKKITSKAAPKAMKAIAKTTPKSAGKKVAKKVSKKSSGKNTLKKNQRQINELGIADIELASKSPRKTGQPSDREASKAFVIEACRLMKDLHCENIIAYDVQGKSDVTDFILIASGTSDRQMRSVGDDLGKLGKTFKLEAFGRHIDGPTTWLVLDLVDVVVHLFEPQARAFYDLEMLWGDCPKVDWKR